MKKLRFRSDVELNVTDPTGMHKAIIGKEWRELPKSLQGAAIAAGAEVDADNYKAETNEQQAGENAIGKADEPAVIRAAIDKLLAKNSDDDFTADGHPTVAAVNAASGMKHTKTDILAVWNVMQDEAAASEASAQAEVGE